MVSEPPATILQARGVYKHYSLGKNLVLALPPTSLEIFPGEFLVVRGPSGAGKSTLLNILSGMEQPSGGSVSLFGNPLESLSEAKLAAIRNRNFGFVFQTPHVLFDRTVSENVLLPAHYGHVGDVAQLRERAGELLEYVGLNGFSDRLPNTLSGGELQRVAFARALVCDPEIIFADEPTGSLDAANSLRMLEFLKHQCGRGKAVVMVTHDHDAMGFADRYIGLEKVSVAEI